MLRKALAGMVYAALALVLLTAAHLNTSGRCGVTGTCTIGDSNTDSIQLTTDGASFGIDVIANEATLTATGTDTGVFRCADAAGAADCAFSTTGTGPVTVGTAGTTTVVTIATDDTGDGTDLVLPANGVNFAEQAFLTIGAFPAATCTAGAIHTDTDETDDTNCTTVADNSLCLCLTDDNWTALNNPKEATEFYVGFTGHDAPTTTVALNTYTVMNLSLGEAFDKNGCFTTNPNEICYTCADTIRVNLVVPISTVRDAGSGTDHLIFAIGKDTTGAIGDGDELALADGAERTFTTTQHGMGSIGATTSLETNDCLSVMAQTNDTAGGSDFSMEQTSFHITEPWPGF